MNSIYVAMRVTQLRQSCSRYLRAYAQNAHDMGRCAYRSMQSKNSPWLQSISIQKTALACLFALTERGKHGQL